MLSHKMYMKTKCRHLQANCVMKCFRGLLVISFIQSYVSQIGEPYPIHAFRLCPSRTQIYCDYLTLCLHSTAGHVYPTLTWTGSDKHFEMISRFVFGDTHDRKYMYSLFILYLCAQNNALWRSSTLYISVIRVNRQDVTILTAALPGNTNSVFQLTLTALAAVFSLSLIKGDILC